MKPLLCILFLLFQGPSALEKQLAAKDRLMDSLKIKVIKITPPASITLEMINGSKKPIRNWKDWNSWGAAHWRVLIIRDGRLETFFENPNQLFTRNVPAFAEIAAHGYIAKRLDLNGGNWCGRGHCSLWDERGIAGTTIRFESGDTLVVVYDVPQTPAGHKMNVWYGVTAVHATVP